MTKNTAISMPYANSFHPRLPQDIERMIFELAVSENGSKASTPLLLVAKRVREWTTPLIFRVLNQIWPAHSPDLTYHPQLLQSAGPFVQHLMIDSHSAYDCFQTVLSSCPNVRNLAIYLPTSWGGASMGEVKLNSLLSVLQKMPRLTRLSMSLPRVFCADLLIRPCLNVTHLEILLPSAFEYWGNWDVLIQFPKLTHISTEGTIRVHDVLKLLQCPRLKLLIVVPPNSDRDRQDLDALCRVEDNRLVLLEAKNHVDVIFDWEKGANGGVDTWMFSELVVLARDRGYFLTTLPNCIPMTFDDWESNLNEEGKQWFSALRLNDH